MKRNMRQTIADAFVSMVEETSLARVRIADIIARLDINRNTFYYHFSSKYDVALWVLRTDLDAELRAALPDNELVCLPLESKRCIETPLAYYAHVETGARTLDCSKFLKAFARCTLGRQDFYRKLFDIRELEFWHCLTDLYYPAVEGDIEFILGGRYMPDATRGRLASLCTRHLLSTVAFCLESDERETLLNDKANPFWNIVHESLYAAIQSHPINRYGPRAEARSSRPS